VAEEQRVRVLTPEEAIEAIRQQTSEPMSVERLPDRYVQFGFGVGHEFMLNVRFHESQLTTVFYWCEKLFDKWLAAHADSDEGDGSGPTPGGVPYHG
jgi:hypothetical protein